jgi:hypothetical protein
VQDTKFVLSDFELVSKLYGLKKNIDLLGSIDDNKHIKNLIFLDELSGSNPYMLGAYHNSTKKINMENLILNLNPKDLSNIDLPLFGLTNTLNLSKQERFLVKNSYMDVDMIYNNQNYVAMKKLLGNGVTNMDAKNNI